MDLSEFMNIILGAGLGLHRFRFRFPHRSTQGTDGCCSAHKAAAKNNVHDLAKVHTTRFLVSQPFILLPRVSFGIVR